MDAEIQIPRTRGAGSLRRILRILVAFALSAGFAFALFSRVPLERVGAALAHADPAPIAAALAGVALAYVVRSERWAVMLRSLGGEVRFRDAAAPLLSCVALNNVLPLRAGDVVRIVAFRRLTKVGPSMQLGSLVLERLLDIASVMAILAATLALAHVGLRPQVSRSLEIVAVLAVLAVAGFLAAPAPLRLIVRAAENKAPRLQPLGERVLRLSQAVAALSRPMLLVRLTLLSLVAWLCEGAAYIAVAAALHVGHEIPAGLLALGLGTLATSIPSSPGYVGTFHYFAALALTELGTDPALAAAYAILIHALLWISTTATGSVLLLASGQKGSRVGGAASSPLPHEGSAS